MNLLHTIILLVLMWIALSVMLYLDGDMPKPVYRWIETVKQHIKRSLWRR